MTHPMTNRDARERLACYDAGLLSDFGGGNVEWWQDYIRAELGRAHDFYQSQFLGSDQPRPSVATGHPEQGALLSGWQPIETAPKDGTGVVAFIPGFGMGALVLFWMAGRWREPANHLGLRVDPTHWMPLPAPPSTTDASQTSGTPNNPSNQTKGGE